jgi:hypothetical protein
VTITHVVAGKWRPEEVEALKAAIEEHRELKNSLAQEVAALNADREAGTSSELIPGGLRVSDV